MQPRTTAWRRSYQTLLEDFKAAANRGSSLRNVRVRPLGRAVELPPNWQGVVRGAQFQRVTEWSPARPGYGSWEQPERGYLYGPREEVELFDRLAERAWLAYPGSPDGKAQMAPREDVADQWLTVVYQQLKGHRGTYLLADGDEWVASRAEDGSLHCLPAEQVSEAALTEGVERWRLAALATDVFTASVVAIDTLLASADEPYAVSWKEMDAYQKSPAFQNANFLVDMIQLGEGRTFPIYRYWCQPVEGNEPSICPNADPPAAPQDRAVLRQYLLAIEQRFRDLHLVGDGQTIHWVGRQASLGTLCRCPRRSESTPGHEALLLVNAAASRTPSVQTTGQAMPPIYPSDKLHALLQKAEASRQTKLEQERRSEESRRSSERFISLLNDVRQATPQLLAERPESLAELPGDDREQFYPRWASRFLVLGREMNAAGLQYQLGELEGHVQGKADADAGHYAVNLIRLACQQDREQLERFLRPAGNNPELHGVRMWLHRLADRLVEMRNRIWVESLANSAQRQLQEQAGGSSKAADTMFQKVQEALDGIGALLPQFQ